MKIILHFGEQREIGKTIIKEWMEEMIESAKKKEPPFEDSLLKLVDKMEVAE